MWMRLLWIGPQCLKVEELAHATSVISHRTLIMVPFRRGSSCLHVTYARYFHNIAWSLMFARKGLETSELSLAFVSFPWCLQ